MQNVIDKNKLQKEIVDNLPRGNLRLILAPRCGKTKIAIDIIKKEKPKSILWVTPSAQLAERDIPEEFNKWKASKYLKILETSTWASLHKVRGYYELIILDEDHSITQANAETLLNETLKGRIIGMTGTDSSHMEKQILYKKLNMPIVYQLNIPNAIEMGILANYRVNVVEVEPTGEIQVKSKNYNFKTPEMKTHKYWDEQCIIRPSQRTFLARRRAIINSPSKEKIVAKLWQVLKGRKLFFCSSIEQANKITPYVYHSKSKDHYLQQFLSEELNNICMVNAGGTGFTYRKLDHLVIAQVDGDKTGQTLQKVCRSLLAQENYEATIWIIKLKKTQDEKWVNNILNKLNTKKIFYYDENGNKKSY